MKQTLTIEHMSCQNCVKHVTEHLFALEGVIGVSVDLDAKQATVDTQTERSQTDYQTALEDTIYEVIAVG
ncbi:copper chaperone CopZ [Streptococcus gallinaceus]|uniref:heavy-metal-associated domain-containing protein n=1 Tax=Streptococcus gallinaceus TaxID=165758 RepID=UPI00209F2670|nr:heavy metal-associated domain-containing protein [Streptococcus gallinaceus]MCP1639859.1 copper chaperone CopZ [Streptococcus gallinaceus]MCP1770769.1 copper chaperone CopZ [Streptococcus gallinaceus]